MTAERHLAGRLLVLAGARGRVEARPPLRRAVLQTCHRVPGSSVTTAVRPVSDV